MGSKAPDSDELELAFFVLLGHYSLPAPSVIYLYGAWDPRFVCVIGESLNHSLLQPPVHTSQVGIHSTHIVLCFLLQRTSKPKGKPQSLGDLSGVQPAWETASWPDIPALTSLQRRGETAEPPFRMESTRKLVPERPIWSAEVPTWESNRGREGKRWRGSPQHSREETPANTPGDIWS